MMELTSWHKQSKDSPLFEDVLWLKPENPRQKPKVLIVGGSMSGLLELTKLYELIKSKSAYQTKVVMPDSVEKLIGNQIADAVYVSSTQSGEMSAEASNEVQEYINWAEAVVIPQGIGNNSETQNLMSKIVSDIDKPTFIIGESISLLDFIHNQAIANQNLVLVGGIDQIQKFNNISTSTLAINQSDGLVKIIQNLQLISNDWSLSVITRVENKVLVVHKSTVSSTESDQEEWMNEFAAESIQFAKMFKSKTIETLSCGAYLLNK